MAKIEAPYSASAILRSRFERVQKHAYRLHNPKVTLRHKHTEGRRRFAVMETETELENEYLTVTFAKEASTQTMPESVDMLLEGESLGEWEYYLPDNGSEPPDEEPEDYEDSEVDLEAQPSSQPQEYALDEPPERTSDKCIQTERMEYENHAERDGPSSLNPRVAAALKLAEPYGAQWGDEPSALSVDIDSFEKYILRGADPFPENIRKRARRIIQDDAYLQCYSDYVEAVQCFSDHPAPSPSNLHDATISLLTFVMRQYEPSYCGFEIDPPAFSFLSPLGEAHKNDAVDCISIFHTEPGFSEEDYNNRIQQFFCTVSRDLPKPPLARSVRPVSPPKTSQKSEPGPSEPSGLSASRKRGRPSTTPKSRKAAKTTRQSRAKPARDVVDATDSESEAEQDNMASSSSIPPPEALEMPPKLRSHSVASTSNSDHRPSSWIASHKDGPPKDLSSCVESLFSYGSRRHVLAVSLDLFHAQFFYFDRAGSVASQKVSILDVRFIEGLLRLASADRRQLGLEPQIRPKMLRAGPGEDPIAGSVVAIQGREYVLEKALELDWELERRLNAVYLAHPAQAKGRARDYMPDLGLDPQDDVIIHLSWAYPDETWDDHITPLFQSTEPDLRMFGRDAFTRLSEGIRGELLPGGADRIYGDRELRATLYSA